MVKNKCAQSNPSKNIFQLFYVHKVNNKNKTN